MKIGRIASLLILGLGFFFMSNLAFCQQDKDIDDLDYENDEYNDGAFDEGYDDLDYERPITEMGTNEKEEEKEGTQEGEEVMKEDEASSSGEIYDPGLLEQVEQREGTAQHERVGPSEEEQVMQEKEDEREREMRDRRRQGRY